MYHRKLGSNLLNIKEKSKLLRIYKAKREGKKENGKCKCYGVHVQLAYIKILRPHLSLSLSLVLSFCTTYKVNKNSNGRKKQLIDRHCNKAKLYFLLQNKNILVALSLSICLSSYIFLHTEKNIPPLSFYSSLS